MVNEDIITALKNAINNGESLDSAMQIMINSGYNPREVQESSRYVSQGVINNLYQDNSLKQPINQQTPQNQFQPQYRQQFQQNLPQQTQNQLPIQQPNQIQNIQPLPNQKNQVSNQISQQLQYQTPIQSQNQKLKPKIDTEKKSYKKEIILVIILIFLIGVLAATIFFKDNILSFFS